jgi:hypothetical protein
VRIRPSIWLEAAGLRGHAGEVAHLSTVEGQPLAVIWPVLDAAARAARSTREVTWQAVAAAADEARGSRRDDGWAAVATATWTEAVAAACHLLYEGARAAGLDPGGAMLRTHSLPDSPGAGWDTTWDVGLDAACVVAWRAVHAIAGPNGPIWSTSADQAWAVACHTARRALKPVLDSLDVSAREVLLRGGLR